MGERGLLIVPDWKGRQLINDLGLEEPTYADAYKDGFADGYQSGYRDGYTAATTQQASEQPSGHSESPLAHSVYRKLVAKRHPDRDGGNEEVMKDINELGRRVARAKGLEMGLSFLPTYCPLRAPMS